jgi:protoporphyrinogen oxidase
MKYIIVGAGVAGLTAAYKLLENGHEVTVLEKEPDIGGLARSFKYGDFIFDIGPHRFFSDKAEIDKFIKSVLKQEYIVIQRKSRIHLLNRYFSWPLGPDMLIKLPLRLLPQIIYDFSVKLKSDNQNFKEYAITKYGKTLFELVFKDYTEKFYGISCEELHHNWLKWSLDKAVINKKIRTDSLFDLFKMIYTSMRFEAKFLYPKGGCGRFVQKLESMINDRGGKIVKDVDNISIAYENNKITSLCYSDSTKKSIELDHLIYTAPITQLAQQLNLGVIDLEYINLIIYNFEINKPLKSRGQWVYFGDNNLNFTRVSFPRNFDKNNVPSGKDSLCVEVTCKNDSMIWSKPYSATERLVCDLGKVKLCQREDIDYVHIEKIANAYPVYKLNYPEELENIKIKLNKFSNLTCLGRTGTFWYNNMDESIEIALRFVEEVTKNDFSR